MSAYSGSNTEDGIAIADMEAHPRTGNPSSGDLTVETVLDGPSSTSVAPNPLIISPTVDETTTSSLPSTSLSVAISTGMAAPPEETGITVLTAEPTASLPETLPITTEENTLSKKDDDGGKAVAKLASYISLFRFATHSERLLLLLATVCGLIHGAAWPVWSLFFGQAIGKFDPNNISAVVNDVRQLALLFVYTGIIVGVCASIHIYIFNTLGSRLTMRGRFNFLRAVVRQDMAWHDTHPSAALDAILTINLPKMQAGISNKLGDFLQQISQGIVGMGIGFYYSWKLTLVFMAFSPVLVICMGSFAVTMGSVQKKQAGIYQKAGVAAAEILTLMRTVITFGTYELELDRYTKFITESYYAGETCIFLYHCFIWVLSWGRGFFCFFLYKYNNSSTNNARHVIINGSENYLPWYNSYISFFFPFNVKVCGWVARLVLLQDCRISVSFLITR